MGTGAGAAGAGPVPMAGCTVSTEGRGDFASASERGGEGILFSGGGVGCFPCVSSFGTSLAAVRLAAETFEFESGVAGL